MKKSFVTSAAVLLAALAAAVLLGGCAQKPTEPVALVCDGPQLSCYDRSTTFLTESGEVYTYGANQPTRKQYYLGLADTDRADAPTRILTGIARLNISGGRASALSLDGKLYVWGYNGGSLHLLGLPADVEVARTPTLLLEDVVDFGQFYAIKSNGELWCWCYGDYIDPATGKSAPAEPHKVLDDIVKCAPGWLGLQSDGTLWAWGDNLYGSRGNGLTNEQDTNTFRPVKIMEGVADIFHNSYTAYAIRDDGSLWAWGYNEYGSCGNGETGDLDAKTVDCVVTAPYRVLDNVTDLSLSTAHDCYALTGDGKLYGFGKNQFFTLSPQQGPVTTPRLLLENVREVNALKTNYVFAVTNDDVLYSWGEYGFGALGTDCSYGLLDLQKKNFRDSEDEEWVDSYCTQPTEVARDIRHYIGGYDLFYAQKTDGSYLCWGMDKSRTVKTYGEANYIEFDMSGAVGEANIGSVTHTSHWLRGCEGPFGRDLEVGDEVEIRGAIGYDLQLIQYPQTCTFPPYQN